jgi:hypothetical protein
VVLIVSVELPPPLSGIATEEGLKVQEGADADDGWTAQLKFTVSLNPFNAMTDIPDTPALPTGMVPGVTGETVRLKSAIGGGGPLFRLNIACTLGPPAGIMKTQVCVPEQPGREGVLFQAEKLESESG